MTDKLSPADEKWVADARRDFIKRVVMDADEIARLREVLNNGGGLYASTARALLDALEQARKERDDYEERQAKVLEMVRVITDERDQAICQMSDYARRMGEAEGKLQASEMVGVLEGWKRERDAARQSAEAARSLLVEAMAWVGTINGDLRARIEAFLEPKV